MKDLWPILISFAKIGVVAYGGGPSMIPIVKAEVVERRGWIGTDEFMDALAIGNALPGPIVTKIAAAVGYHKAGWGGATAALIGVVLPSAVALLVLLGFVSLVRDNPMVESMLRGLRPVVVAMLAYAVWDMAPSALKGYITVAIALAAFALMVFTPIHPALLIVAGAAVGLILGFMKKL